MMNNKKTAEFKIVMDEQQFQTMKVALLYYFMNANPSTDERAGIEDIMEQISDYKKGIWEELRLEDIDSEE